MATKKTGSDKPKKSPKKKTKPDLDAALAALSPEARSAAPDKPVAVVLLEAERLLSAALRLKKALLALPSFPADQLPLLDLALPALSDAERAWQKARFRTRESTLGATRKEAEALRARLLATGRYMLRHDAAARAEVERISEGEGLADLVQDLRDLGVLVGSQLGPFLAAPGVPANVLDTLSSLADTLGGGLDGESAQQAQERRNALCALVSRAVDEIRAAARFLLHGDPKRLDPFLSRYEANRKRRQRERHAAPPEAPPSPA